MLIQINFLEGGVRRKIGAIELRKAAIQVNIVCPQKLAEIGRLAADDVFEKQVERLSGGRTRSAH